MSSLIRGLTDAPSKPGRSWHGGWALGFLERISVTGALLDRSLLTPTRPPYHASLLPTATPLHVLVPLPGAPPLPQSSGSDTPEILPWQLAPSSNHSPASSGSLSLHLPVTGVCSHCDSFSQWTGVCLSLCPFSGGDRLTAAGPPVSAVPGTEGFQTSSAGCAF